MTDYIIYPRPQWIQASKRFWTIPEHARIAVADEKLFPIAERVQMELRRRHQLDMEAAKGMDEAIVLGTLDHPGIRERCETAGLLTDERVLQHEGYVLHIDDGGALIAGADEAGLFYGVHSFLQLVSSEKGVCQTRVVHVRDWPYKAIRGIHVYMPGREQIPFLKHLLSLLAAFKYNTVFLEVGGGMRYDRHPEINEGWEQFVNEAKRYPGGPPALQRSQPFPKDSTHTELAGGSFLEKDEVRDLIAYANGLHIEVIPEVQSLSHAYYLIYNHREIAERADDPWPDTYCPSNPASYRLYFDVLEEIIEVFQPRMIHIGHDEAYLLGECPRCKGKSGAGLLAGDLNKIHGFLAERGVRTVLWGDKLQNIIIGGVNHGGRARHVVCAHGAEYTMLETCQAVDRVPQDLIIMDWYWCLDPRSEQFFQDKGFEVIFGNFGDNFSPQTFWQWDKRSQGEHILGAEAPTWCAVNEFALGHNACLFNFLFSANMMWWANYCDRERERTLKAVASIQPTFRDRLSGQAAPSRSTGAKTYSVLSLKGAYNIKPEFADKLPQSLMQCDIPFELEPSAVGTDAGTRESAAIPVGTKVHSLAFLHGAHTGRRYRPTWSQEDPVHPSGEDVLGYYEITFEDGTVSRTDIRYGENIARTDLRYGEEVAAVPYWADVAWEGYDHEGKPITLYSYEWTNPWPEKAVREVRSVYTDDSDKGQVLLFGVTAISLS